MAQGIDSAPGVAYGTGGLAAGGTDYVSNFLTNFFLPVVADARNNSSVLWNLLKKQAHMPVSGRFIVFPVRYGRNTGINAMRPGSNLPDPTSQGSRMYSLETRSLYARVKIEGEILRRGRTNGGAFIDAQLLEIESQADDFAVMQNRIVHNDGSGSIAESNQVNTTSSTTLLIRPNNNIPRATSSAMAVPKQYFEIGDRIGIVGMGATGSAGGVLRTTAGGQSGFYVVTVGINSLQLALTPGGAAINLNTISGGADGVTTGMQVGDFIVRMGNDGAGVAVGVQNDSAWRAEPMGIAGVFTTGGVFDGNGIGGAQQTGAQDYTSSVGNGNTIGFQGLSTTGQNAFNQGVVLDNGGSGNRPITDELMQQAFSDAEEINNASIDLILSAYDPYNSYVKTLVPDKRYNDTLELNGGHKVLTFNGVPWYKDRFAYGKRAYMLNLDEFTVYETEPLQPLAAFDVPRWERLLNKDAYFSGMVTSWNMGVGVRQRAGALLTEVS